jgi:excinuclease ABC subunit B
VEGLVIFYADKITESMQRTIDETNRRREKQLQYNTEHHITPATIAKSTEEIFGQTSVLSIRNYQEGTGPDLMKETDVEEEETTYDSVPQLEKAVARAKRQMEKAAKDMDFLEAARLRDKMLLLQQQLKAMKGE